MEFIDFKWGTDNENTSSEYSALAYVDAIVENFAITVIIMFSRFRNTIDLLAVFMLDRGDIECKVEIIPDIDGESGKGWE